MDLNYNNKEKRVKQTHEKQATDEGFNDVVSCTECTGMMSTPADTGQKEESYSAIYDIPVPCTHARSNREMTQKTKK